MPREPLGVPSGDLCCSRSASPCVPAVATRLLIPLAGLLHRQLPAGGHRSEPSNDRATSSLSRRLWPAACGWPRFIKPAWGHSPSAYARRRGSTPRRVSRRSTSSQRLLRLVAPSRTLAPCPSLAAIRAMSASLHATWRPLLLHILIPCFPADTPRLLIPMAGPIHRQPGSGGRRSAQGSARAIEALSCQPVAGSVCRRRMGQAGRLPLPIGGKAAGDPRRSAQRASDGTTHMRCGQCGDPWPRPTHLSLCVVCSGMVGRVTHACVEYLVSTASIYKLLTGNLGWNDTSK